ncbi:MAG TPA: alpha/beta fold hydrolase, partial [Terriglobales bacterium]|nr:alpha/beta fold hydrolase [Terriglobales bacterium]
GDAEICFEVAGSGPPVILLHPFPVCREFWIPVAEFLSSRYFLIMPDLRGHGDSGLGEGPATMAKHAADVARIMSASGIDRASIVGVSIGGYVIFELWRQMRERISALVLCNTKAGNDSPESRAGRLQTAQDVLQTGTEVFFEGMLEKILGESTRSSRPDLVDGALRMMRKMSPEDVAGVQRGMADRADSVPIAYTIDVPTLILTGDEDRVAGVAEAEVMKQSIRGSDMRVIEKAGHYSPWEQPQEVGRLLRTFLDPRRQ